jgi:hypothetical protein
VSLISSDPAHLDIEAIIKINFYSIEMLESIASEVSLIDAKTIEG